jgi:hypothetical protein
MNEFARPQDGDLSGSWSFSVRTSMGRVIAYVPNKVLGSCFGARNTDESFRFFASHIQLLHEAALVQLEKGFSPVIEIKEENIAAALGRMH